MFIRETQHGTIKTFIVFYFVALLWSKHLWNFSMVGYRHSDTIYTTTTRFQWYCWDTWRVLTSWIIIFCPYILTLCLIDHHPRTSRSFLYCDNVFCALTAFCNLLQDWVQVVVVHCFSFSSSTSCQGVSRKFSPLLISYGFCYYYHRKARGTGIIVHK